MAAGDTIAGVVRIVKEEAGGHRVVVLGSIPTSYVDKDSSYFTHVNPDPDLMMTRGDHKYIAKGAIFEASEVLDIQHLSSSSEVAGDYDADEFFIDVIETDLNHPKRPVPKTLTVHDTELTSDPTTSVTDWVSIFKYTVPDRRRIAIAGMVKVAIVTLA